MINAILTHLYAHTTMTMDDILYIAARHGIDLDTTLEDQIKANSDGDSLTFEVTAYDDGTIFIFDI